MDKNLKIALGVAGAIIVCVLIWQAYNYLQQNNTQYGQLGLGVLCATIIILAYLLFVHKPVSKAENLVYARIRQIANPRRRNRIGIQNYNGEFIVWEVVANKGYNGERVRSRYRERSYVNPYLENENKKLKDEPYFGTDPLLGFWELLTFIEKKWYDEGLEGTFNKESFDATRFEYYVRHPREMGWVGIAQDLASAGEYDALRGIGGGRNGQ